MTLETRLGKLYPALTARERALVVLRTWKDGRETDPRSRLDVPAAQVAEYNRLIDLMNAVNRGFSMVLIILDEQLTHIELKAAWLSYITYTAKHVRALAAYIFETKEPITPSARRERGAHRRAELLTLDEAARLLAARHAFADDDMADEDGERSPTDAAWERVCEAKRRAIRAAVGTGELCATGKGARTRVAVGALCDWAALPVDVEPDWGLEFDVRPDADEAAVQEARETRALLRKLVERVCPADDWPIAPATSSADPDDDILATSLGRALAGAIVSQVLSSWQQLRAIEVVVAEVAQEFDSEDPLGPRARDRIDDAKARVGKLAEELRPYVGALALPEPDDTDLADARELLDRYDE